MKDTCQQVLLVDDDPTLLRSLARSLEDHGFEVLTSTCTAEARAILKRNKVSTIICDYAMPGEAGLDFLAEVRSTHPAITAMMLSGMVSGVGVAEQWAEEIGVKEVLAKPCDVDHLAEKILAHSV